MDYKIFGGLVDGIYISPKSDSLLSLALEQLIQNQADSDISVNGGIVPTLSRIDSDSQICRDMPALQVQVQMFDCSSRKSMEAGNGVDRVALG